MFSTAANAQNVGIGTDTPNDGKLEIISATGNQLISRNTATSTGLSFSIINNNPTLGFNGMGKNTNDAYGYLGTGYAGFLEYSPVTGTFNFFSGDVSAATPNVDLTGGTSSLFSISRLGYLGLGQAAPLEGLHLKGKNIRLDNLFDARSVMLLSGDDGRLGGEIRLFSNGSADSTVVIKASNGDGLGGDIALINPSTLTRTAQMNGGPEGGEIKLFPHGETDSTIIIKGSNAVGNGAEILFVNPATDTRTMEISGNYNSSGRSRIIVDELQIKGGADFAEYFDITAPENETPLPGMLVSIDENNTGKLTVSNIPYDKKVAGVISGANGILPGMTMGHKNTIADGAFPVAISGRIYVMADATKNPINPGDQLTTSSLPGYAMKATNYKKAQGAIIGKAMSKLSGGKGMVLVLIGTR
ncbi:hypothetical protein EGI32_07775 [Ferruginibacter sp. HRS2-29]|nr:hypothetical protein [Ferruginibacter sp. HRS2-29]